MTQGFVCDWPECDVFVKGNARANFRYSFRMDWPDANGEVKPTAFELHGDLCAAHAEAFSRQLNIWPVLGEDE